MSEAPSPRIASNRTTLIACVALVGVMVGAAYAAVPLYRLFCQLTGFGGTTQVASAAPANALAQSISVRFDANVAPGLPWTFKAETPVTTLKIGETAPDSTGRNRSIVASRGASRPRKKDAKQQLPTRSTLSPPNAR